MTLQIPNTFVAGTKAKATEMNQNFTACQNAINTNVSNIATNAGAIAELSDCVLKKDGSTKSKALQSYATSEIVSATNATPIVVTSIDHGRDNGDIVYISGVQGNTATNGAWAITVIDTNTFSLNNSVGNAAYTSGGTVYLLPSNPQNLTSKQYVDLIVPAGHVDFFATTSAPTGYLKANGAAISRITYGNLFNAIGTTFGTGDGTTTFNLPDLRDCFIRGYSDAQINDVTSLYGTITSGSAIITGLSYTSFMYSGMAVSGSGIPTGTTIKSVDSATQITLSANVTASASAFLTFTGRKFGSVELDQIQNIVGYFYWMQNCANSFGATGPFRVDATTSITDWSGGGSSGAQISFDASRAVRAGGETRPRNVALLACIKY